MQAIARGVDCGIGMQDDGLRGADARVVIGAAHECVQPAWLRFAVVIEEDEVSSARQCGRLVASTRESDVLVVAHQPHDRPVFSLVPRAVVGGVVHDDDLVGAGRRCARQRVEAAAEPTAPAVIHDHHTGRDWFGHGS